MTKYIYDGVITQSEGSGVKDMLQKYPFAVECKGIPMPLFIEWGERNIEKVKGTGEGCMGEPTTKEYVPWATVGCRFFFFLREEDYHNFSAAFFVHIVKYRPFKTVI